MCYNAYRHKFFFLSAKAFKEVAPFATKVVKRASIDYPFTIKTVRSFYFVESLTRKPRFTNIMQQYLHLTPEHSLLVSPEEYRRDIFKCLDKIVTDLYDEKANESKDIII